MTPAPHFMDETMNAQLLFPHIGKAIASTGSRHFPRRLHDLIATQLAVDTTHIRQLPVERQPPPLGQPCSAANDAIDHHEPTWLGATLYDQGSHPASALQHPAQPAQPSAQAQLHVSGRRDAYRYVISLYRGASFSAQERLLLQDFSSLLLPMVEKHLSALHPPSSGPAGVPSVPNLDSLHLRFVERLAQCGLNLSHRELQICTGLLAGRTAPELAEALQLKVNTVESYLKRAAIKLGISGRHSLLRWMYGGEHAAACVTD